MEGQARKKAWFVRRTPLRGGWGVASRQCKKCSVRHAVMIYDRGTMGVNGDAMTRALLTAGATLENVHRSNLFPVLAQKRCGLRLVQALQHRLLGF